MAKKLYLVLGNGFTIDFLSHVNLRESIDVVNLFRRGTEVPWPVTGSPGFLSFKHCPHLWNLGARPDMSSLDVMLLIEDIITCVNVFASKPKASSVGRGYKPNDIYIYAYKELSEYLKHLFIFYDKSVEQIPDSANTWAWLEFLKFAHESDYYSEVTVVTYNYDIWLERLLTNSSIPFNIGLIGDVQSSAKITILKPHGSISFCHKNELDKDSYAIKTDHELLDGDTEDFRVLYGQLERNFLVSALIPPAGESTRLNHTWASRLRESAKQKASNLTSDDEMIVCGLSYWNVDRAELDEILISCDPLVNVTMVNPSPHRTINAVLTSIFSNFLTYSSSSTLRERIKCLQS